MRYKEIDYTIIEDRVLAVLEENGENDITGIADALIYQLGHSSEVSIDMLYDFAERYGCSVDYILGRTDKYWL